MGLAPRNAGGAQRFLCLPGALARAAHEDDRVGDASDIDAVLRERVERHIVRAVDVLGVELARRADVEEACLWIFGAQAREVGGEEQTLDGRGRASIPRQFIPLNSTSQLHSRI
jgi:hypothetical protein